MIAFLPRVLFFMLLLIAPVNGAGPIVHLWAAEKYCEIYGIVDEEKIRQFIIGTEFPDIRYIANLPRKDTHPPVVDIEEIQQCKTAFEMGMKLHGWIDKEREAFIASCVYEEVLSYAEGHAATLLKFIEDEILIQWYETSRFCSCFSHILQEEIALVPTQILHRWHGIIQLSFTYSPSTLLWMQSFVGPLFHVKQETLYRWSCLLIHLKEQRVFTDHVLALLLHLENKMKQKNDS